MGILMYINIKALLTSYLGAIAVGGVDLACTGT